MKERETNHACVEFVEVLDAVKVLENLGRNGLTEPEDRTFAVLDEIGSVRFHPRVTRPHELRENELTPLVGEADLVGKEVDSEHARVEHSNGRGNATALELAHRPCSNVGRDDSAWRKTKIGQRCTRSAEGGGEEKRRTLESLRLHQRESIQGEELEGLGEYELWEGENVSLKKGENVGERRTCAGEVAEAQCLR